MNPKPRRHRFSLHSLPLLLATPATLALLVMSACGDGSDDADDFVPPAELCPAGVEVDGIAGRVVTMQATVPKAEVTLVYEDRSRPTTTVTVTGSEVRDDDAVFRFRDVPDGTHTLRACVSTFHSELEVEVVDGKSSFVCLRLDFGGC